MTPALTAPSDCEKFPSLPEEAAPDRNQAPPREISQVVEHLFRHEAGKLVATLAGIFGIEHLTLAEDVVQEALARALQTWPFYGVPQNPPAWIMRTARNLALDVVRRQRVLREKEAEIARLIEDADASPEPTTGESEIADDRLRLMFVCCHPQIPPEAQSALALKTLCGFSIPEIARAFLTSEAAIAKRLTRAKQKISQAGIRFEIPAGPELASRLDGVLQSLYLLFNEGYKASAGDKLVREEICAEAIRLADLLVRHPAGNQPRAHALLALMLLTAARTPARTNEAGDLLRLQDQDRSRWDQALIARGMYHLAQSAAGAEISAYHLQAGIAACHCRAPDYASTDWRQILSLYDRLAAFDDSPVIALNRAVACAEVNGPQAGIAAVEAIKNRRALEAYYLFHAVMGAFESRRNRAPAAAAHFRQALELAEIKSEQAFLAERLRECDPEREPAVEKI
jgi:RNA polymerase sigma-70 factor (ECF subfamily)